MTQQVATTLFFNGSSGGPAAAERMSGVEIAALERNGALNGAARRARAADRRKRPA